MVPILNNITAKYPLYIGILVLLLTFSENIHFRPPSQHKKKGGREAAFLHFVRLALDQLLACASSRPMRLKRAFCSLVSAA
jgi:hypothetical protein